MKSLSLMVFIAININLFSQEDNSWNFYFTARPGTISPIQDIGLNNNYSTLIGKLAKKINKEGKNEYYLICTVFGWLENNQNVNYNEKGDWLGASAEIGSKIWSDNFEYSLVGWFTINLRTKKALWNFGTKTKLSDLELGNTVLYFDGGLTTERDQKDIKTYVNTTIWINHPKFENNK